MWILSLLAWPFRFFKSFMDYRTQKAIIQGEVAKESIRANVELSQIKYHMHKLNMGWWATRWIVPLIAYPVITWWVLVWADTIGKFGWKIDAPPEPIYSWSGEIILSFFIVRGVETVANAATAWTAAGTVAKVVGRVFGRGEK